MKPINNGFNLIKEDVLDEWQRKGDIIRQSEGQQYLDALQKYFNINSKAVHIDTFYDTFDFSHNYVDPSANVLYPGNTLTLFNLVGLYAWHKDIPLARFKIHSPIYDDVDMNDISKRNRQMLDHYIPEA